MRKSLSTWGIIWIATIACLLSSNSFTKDVKSYVDELEEAYVAKIAKSRAERRLRRKGVLTPEAKTPETPSIGPVKKDENTIGEAVAKDIETTVKQPVINLLGSIHLTSWAELKARFDRAKKALEIFEVKYKSQLATTGKAPAVTEEDSEDDDEDSEEEDEETKPKPKPRMGMPGARKPAVKRPMGMPGARKPAVKRPMGMPGARKPVAKRPMGMPGAKPAVKRPMGMPGAKPAIKRPMGMPGVKPAAAATAEEEEEEQEEDEEEE